MSSEKQIRAALTCQNSRIVSSGLYLHGLELEALTNLVCRVKKWEMALGANNGSNDFPLLLGGVYTSGVVSTGMKKNDAAVWGRADIIAHSCKEREKQRHITCRCRNHRDSRKLLLYIKMPSPPYCALAHLQNQGLEWRGDSSDSVSQQFHHSEKSCYDCPMSEKEGRLPCSAIMEMGKSSVLCTSTLVDTTWSITALAIKVTEIKVFLASEIVL